MAIYGKTPTALLLDKVNSTSPVSVPLTEFNCTIGTPKSIPVTPEGYNTEVKISGVQGRGYIGVTTFQYTRIDLALLFKNSTLIVDSPTASSTWTAIPNINARYGINLTQPDINNITIIDGGAFNLVAATGSLQYIGQAPARYSNAGYRLNDVIYQRNLDTLNHPVSAIDISNGYRSGGMIGFAIDYTPEANVITAMANGPMGTGINFTSGASDALVNTMVGLGFPRWDYSKSTITLYASGIVANANPKYLVAVITDVVDTNIRGPIYLHYNLQ